MDNSGVNTYRQNVLLKSSENCEQTSDKEALQLSHKILHVISSDLKSPKQRVRNYAVNVIRRAGLGVQDDNS
jgi:hypothetical protein